MRVGRLLRRVMAGREGEMGGCIIMGMGIGELGAVLPVQRLFC
jgi:hypothetical protein